MFTTKAQVSKFVNNLTGLVVAHAKERGWVDDNFSVDVTVSTAANRKRSWGGVRAKPFVSLAVARFMNQEEVLFQEYKSFQTDSMIGTVKGSAEKALAALVVHELGHAIQFKTQPGAFGSRLVADDRGHGELWKAIYRNLRNQFVNNVEFAAAPQVAKVTKHGLPHKISKTPKTVVVKSFSRSDLFAKFQVLYKGNTTAYQIAKYFTDHLGVNKGTATSYAYQFKKQLEN